MKKTRSEKKKKYKKKATGEARPVF